MMPEDSPLKPHELAAYNRAFLELRDQQMQQAQQSARRVRREAHFTQDGATFIEESVEFFDAHPQPNHHEQDNVPWFARLFGF